MDLCFLWFWSVSQPQPPLLHRHLLMKVRYPPSPLRPPQGCYNEILIHPCPSNGFSLTFFLYAKYGKIYSRLSLTQRFFCVNTCGSQSIVHGMYPQDGLRHPQPANPFRKACISYIQHHKDLTHK